MGQWSAEGEAPALGVVYTEVYGHAIIPQALHFKYD